MLQPQPSTTHTDQCGRSGLAETGTRATKNPWLASFLLRQLRRACDVQSQLRVYAFWLWVRGQAGGVRVYNRLKAMRPSKRLVGSTVTGAVLLLASAGPVLAGTITVNSATDDSIGCTLREAIVAANTDAAYGGCSGAAGNDIIDMSGINGTITLASNLPVITETVQLNGPGAGSLTIDGGSSFNALRGTGAGTSIGVEGLTVTNVISDGIYARETVTVANSTVTGNDCGVYVNDGAAVVSNSTVTGQGCTGVIAYGGATITDSTVMGNDSGVRAFGDVSVTNSVITGTTYEGADSFANVTVISSTVTGAHSGVYSYTGNVMVANSVISGTTYNGVDAYANATVSNSRVVGAEAGIDTDTGTVLVSNSTIIGAGPGIDATASATVISSTVTGGNGHGISSSLAGASVSYSTVSGGVTGVVAPLNITINSSTISGSGQHGVQSLTGLITINHSTIVNNGGNGIVNNGGTTVIHHTIVAQNAQSGNTHDINATLDASSSYNLIGNGDGAGISNGTNGNRVGSTGAVLDPLLGSLQNNGGPTATHLPAPGSPAIDAGDPGFSGPPDFDQRGSGFPRVIDTIDIGAVEGTFERVRLPIILKS